MQVQACGVWYQGEWIEEVNLLKAIQLSCCKSIEKMKVQRLINQLASQFFQSKERLNGVENLSSVAESNPKTLMEHKDTSMLAPVGSKSHNTVGSTAKKLNIPTIDLIDLPSCGHAFCSTCWSNTLG